MKSQRIKWKLEGIVLVPEKKIPYVQTIVYPSFVIRDGWGLPEAVLATPDPRARCEIRDRVSHSFYDLDELMNNEQYISLEEGFEIDLLREVICQRSILSEPHERLYIANAKRPEKPKIPIYLD